MTRRPLVLLAGSLALLPFPFGPLKLPTAVERLLHNPRERMSAATTATAASGAADRQKAVAAADLALRLAPSSANDPLVRYDAGTVHLRAGDAKGALPLLEQAAHAAPPGLASAAAYNLGNARFAQHELAGAISAYRQALRVDPGNQEAKFNLELAQRQQQENQAKMPSGGTGERGGGNSNSPSGGNDRPGDEKNRGAADPGKSPKPADAGDHRGQSGQGRPEAQKGNLPQFRDQPDMNAAEAAALLESVENLERAQRRAQAGQRAQRRAAKGKDW